MKARLLWVGFFLSVVGFIIVTVIWPALNVWVLNKEKMSGLSFAFYLPKFVALHFVITTPKSFDRPIRAHIEIFTDDGRQVVSEWVVMPKDKTVSWVLDEQPDRNAYCIYSVFNYSGDHILVAGRRYQVVISMDSQDACSIEAWVVIGQKSYDNLILPPLQEIKGEQRQP